MPPSIATPRTRLVPVAIDDAEWMCALLRQPDVRRFLSDDAQLAAGHVDARIAESLDPGAIGGLWRIIGDGAAIGLVGLRPPTHDVMRLRAIGWRSLALIVALDPGTWGRGFATEVVGAMVAHAGQDGVTFALLAAVDEPNLRSHKLAQRCGFQELGRVAGPKHPLVVYERAV